LNSQQTSPGRIRRLAIGFLIGALAVGGLMVYNAVSYNTGANLGKVDKTARTFGEPRRTPYPGGGQRDRSDDPRAVTFIVRQAGVTMRLNVVTAVRLNPKKDLLKRVAVYKRNTTAEPGSVATLSAEIAKNDRTNAAGPLECSIVINGLIYTDHGDYHPYGTEQTSCQASAVVP
jgi:hypothetical protein